MTKSTFSVRRVEFLVQVIGIAFISAIGTAAQPRPAAKPPAVPKPILLQIIRTEDERRWDAGLAALLTHQNAAVRKRAASAAGRIGNELAVPSLASLLNDDSGRSVRSMAAFALGEIESVKAVEPLTAQLSKGESPRGRIVEALGKIAAALPQSNEAQKKEIGKTILAMLSSEFRRRSLPDTEAILLALTATLRARPEGAGPLVAEFLSSSDPRVRADAANTLARLRLKDGNEKLRKLLRTDSDAVVRSNAARVLSATEDKPAFDGLLDRALNDPDKRVRVSAIRALASLRDQRATDPLFSRARKLRAEKERNELLEIVSAIGRLEENSKSAATTAWLKEMRDYNAPEVEIALARVSPQLYTTYLQDIPANADWLSYSVIGQGAAELANVKTGNAPLDASIKSEVTRNFRQRLSCPESPRLVRGKSVKIRPDMVLTSICVPIPAKAIPDWLRAVAAFKPKDSDEQLREYLKYSDVIVRATAAELLGAQPNSANIEALSSALRIALRDKGANDAALAILDALAKQKNSNANEIIKLALASPDEIVRRKAVGLLKDAGAGDFTEEITPIKTRNSAADYARAISRMGKYVEAAVTTSKGSFKIELLPEEAPLNVDNFVQLAKRGYFNGIVFHRVVPNFVIQGGDPRGDGNGGPGYQIRCEINEVPYVRGAVGMALSGKDTGGSQWFVTHAPQPHLDGGYTVFGNVIAGMEVVDNIARGDRIKSIVVTEKPARKIRAATVDIVN